MHRLAAWTIAASALAGGCFEPRTIVCQNGALCPSTLACTETPDPQNEKVCGRVEEVEVCKGKEQNAICDVMGGADDAGVAISGGYCNQRVCVPCDPNFAFCPTKGWELMASPGGGINLTELWVGAPNVALAAGSRFVMMYDGDKWTQLTEFNSVSIKAPISALWGLKNSDAKFDALLGDIEGRVYRNSVEISQRSPDIVTDMWAADASRVFGVAGSEQVGSFTGAWTWQQLPPPEMFPLGLQSVSGADGRVVAVGASVMGVWQNETWSRSVPPTVAALSDVFVASATEMFVVGSETSAGRIFHVVGSNWNLVHPSGTPPMNSIWGTGPNDVWAVGDGGTILHYDGSTWQLSPVPVQARLTGVMGAGSDVFAISDDGLVLRYKPRPSP